MSTGEQLIKINDPALHSKCYVLAKSDPNLRKLCGEYLANAFRTYCNQPSMYANSTFCQTWCANDSGNCPSISVSLGQYCNTDSGFKTPYCLSWCQRNPGYCNDGVKRYCEENPDSDICSCLKSPMLDVTGLIPECHDGKCRNFGYKAYTPTSCPDYIDCRQSLEIQNVLGNVDITGVTFEQNCGGQTEPPVVDVPPVIPADPIVTPTDDGGILGLSNTMVIIMVVLFILLILMGITLYYFKIGEKPIGVNFL